MFGTIRLGFDSDKQQTLEERQPIHERCQETPQVQSALERLIAIVDDDTYTRDGVRALVESYGYLGITFATSEEYLAAGIADRTACLILDVNLPGMSGPDLQDELRLHGYRTPIVFVTGKPSEVTRKRVLQAGATAYLSKPCRDNAMMDCLERAVGLFISTD